MGKTISGTLIVKILSRHFGFIFISQKGSHVKLVKKVGRTKITTIVPLHRELAYGTLKSVLNLAQVDEAEFRKYL